MDCKIRKALSLSINQASVTIAHARIRPQMRPDRIFDSLELLGSVLCCPLKAFTALVHLYLQATWGCPGIWGPKLKYWFAYPSHC